VVAPGKECRFSKYNARSKNDLANRNSFVYRSSGRFRQACFFGSAASVDVYDFVEVTARVAPGPSNPFVGASLNGELRLSNQQPLSATGLTVIRFVDAHARRLQAHGGFLHIH
jgi:hypothetical protein